VSIKLLPPALDRNGAKRGNPVERVLMTLICRGFGVMPVDVLARIWIKGAARVDALTSASAIATTATAQRSRLRPGIRSPRHARQ
jgi:hypothetical protein